LERKQAEERSWWLGGIKGGGPEVPAKAEGIERGVKDFLTPPHVDRK